MEEHLSHRRVLLAGGSLLVLLGLLSGLAVGAMVNPRMGLSAHLEGVFNGTLLIAVGCAWKRLSLNRRWRLAALVLLLYGAYANWLTTQLSAVWGTGRMTPLAAPDRGGTEMQEAFVAFGLISLSLAMLAAFAILVVGFWRAR